MKISELGEINPGDIILMEQECENGHSIIDSGNLNFYGNCLCGAKLKKRKLKEK